MCLQGYSTDPEEENPQNAATVDDGCQGVATFVEEKTSLHGGFWPFLLSLTYHVPTAPTKPEYLLLFFSLRRKLEEKKS